MVVFQAPALGLGNLRIITNIENECQSSPLCLHITPKSYEVHIHTLEKSLYKEIGTGIPGSKLPG